METTRRDFMRAVGAMTLATGVAGQAAGEAQGTQPSDQQASSEALKKGRRFTVADFYVAPNGNDQQPGTREKPFQSLSRARDAVFELKSKHHFERPIVVMLRGGTYPFTGSVVFSARDSGTEKAPIIYTAYPGEHPILSGGQPVTGWKVYKDQIMCTVLPKDEDHYYYTFRQLFFNGKRQIRARYPNFDPQNPLYGGWAFIGSTEPADSTTPVSFRWEPGVFTRRWAKPEQGEIFIIPGLAWYSDFLPIREVDFDKRMISVTRKLSIRWNRLMKGNRFYVENLLEELDQPGEWCFDSDTNTLYFWPPGGTLENAEVTIPATERIIELRATTGEPVRHLHFTGLTFTQTLEIFPSPVPQVADYVDCNRPNSAGYTFFMENTEHCAIEDCRFDQVGGDAIRLHNYNAHNRIVGNEIVEAGAQGICLAYLDFWPYDFPPIWRDKEQQLRSVSSRLPWAISNVISRNHIHHCGKIDNFGAGIHFHGLNCRENVISHNLIHDMPHHALYFSMGFGRNIVECNDLHTLCLVMADAGGFYSNRWRILEGDDVLGNNNVIRYNLIREVRGVYPFGKAVADPATTPSQERIRTPYFTWAIYFDNSPRRAHVYGNVTVDNVWGGILLGGGFSEPANCVVENNIFIENSEYQMDLSMSEHATGNRLLRNIVYYRNPKAALLRLRSPKGIEECDHNLYFHAGQELRVAGVPDESFERWQAMSFDNHTIVGDPLFVDPDQGDYRLKPESPAFKLGFKAVPVERIGIKGRE